jgi:hypothetical protein
MILNIAPQKLIAALVYRTQSALNGDAAFLVRLKAEYPYAGNCLVNDEFHLWHYSGTHFEIAQAMTAISKIPNGSRAKFPAILDFLPVMQLVDGNCTLLMFDLAIAASTDSAWNSAQRDRLVFEPLLNRVYEEFMTQIAASGYFIYPAGLPRHERYNCYTTGKYKGAIVETYTEYIDVIEIRGLQLTLKGRICERDIARMEEDNALVLSDIQELLKN